MARNQISGSQVKDQITYTDLATAESTKFSVVTASLIRQGATMVLPNLISDAEVDAGTDVNGRQITAARLKRGAQLWGKSKTLAVFTAMDGQPPASAYATLDTRNSIPVLDFDDTADESAVFMGKIPEGANLASSVVVILTWMATTATSGNVRWALGWERDQAGSIRDLDVDDFVSDVYVVSAATIVGAGVPISCSVTLTSINSTAVGDLYRLRVMRNSTDTTNDTMTGDAELIAVEVRSAT